MDTENPHPKSFSQRELIWMLLEGYKEDRKNCEKRNTELIAIIQEKDKTIERIYRFFWAAIFSLIGVIILFAGLSFTGLVPGS